MSPAQALLVFSGVSKRFRSGDGPDRWAVRKVDLQVCAGETLSIVGESGSGKSTMIRLALGLLTPETGSVVLCDRDWMALRSRQRRQLRANVGVVFQEPFGALDPLQRVVDIVGEPLRVHDRNSRGDERRQRVVHALEQVGLDSSSLLKVPGQLSGGQQQRVGIARAIVGRPKIVLLDEPTSALDVSVQAQILELLATLRTELNAAYVLVTHDLGIAGYLADRVVVMRNGEVVEQGSVEEIFDSPSSPYTRELLDARLI